MTLINDYDMSVSDQHEERIVTHERILVVDDSFQSRTLLSKQILGAEGYDVLTARSGAEGLLLASELRPDLIIAEQWMPEMTGLDMLQTLTEMGISIPLILVTTEGSEKLAMQAMRAGVRDYLPKPFKSDDLLYSVRRALSNYWSSQIKERLPAQLMETNRKLQKHINQLNTLVNVGKSVTGMRDIQQVLNHIVEAAIQVTDAEESSLFLIDVSTGELYMRAARNFDQKTVQTLRLKVADSLIGQVVQSGKPILVNGEDIKINTLYLVKSLIYVPLRVKQQVIGVLSVDHRTTYRTFESQDVQILSVLADLAAVAVENAHLYAATIRERNTLDAILRDTEDPVIVVDTEDKVLFCNPTARQIFNVTITDFIGKPLKEVILNEEIQRLFSRDALQGRGRHGEITVDGGEHVFNAQLTIIDGVGRSAVMQDITRLKELDKAKSDFVTTVSHDLRSPLTAILAYVELIQRVGPLNDQQVEFVQKIVASVQAVSELTAELLELGHIEKGFDADFEPVAMTQIIHNSIAAFSHQREMKNQTLLTDIDPDVPLVPGNALRLRQVINNLLGNAIKYTPPKGSIKLGLHTDGTLVTFEVTDSGIGIPIDDQPHVFEKFYRSPRAVNNFEGTGLGLAIVKTIVDQHNGRIWLESKEGKGTRFTVVLPSDGAR